MITTEEQRVLDECDPRVQLARLEAEQLPNEYRGLSRPAPWRRRKRLPPTELEINETWKAFGMRRTNYHPGWVQ